MSSVLFRFLSPALLLAVSLMPAPALSQTFDLLVSTSADETAGAQLVGDEEFVLHPAGGVLRPAWPAATLALLLGESGVGSLHMQPGDVDAVHDPGDSIPGGGLFFSLVSNQGVWEDGDILRVQASGVVVAWKEEILVGVLGVTDGNLDVDALHMDADGTFLLSLAEDEASSVLSGDHPGKIEDGDVLRWNPVTGAVSMELTESAVDALVAHALGVASATGDLKGLARDPNDGSLLFCVQSPSAHDGSVFSTANGGMLLPGHQESDFGFDGAGELDALSVALTSWPGLQTSSQQPVPGTSVVLSVEGLLQGQAAVLLMAEAYGPSWFDLPGWGGLVLAEDGLLAASLSIYPFLVAAADGNGRAEWSFDLPIGIIPGDVVAQAVVLNGVHAASNPVLIEAAQ